MRVKPLLRWAGGKNWLTKYIDCLLPNKFENYYEPFLGGGAMFFYLKSKGEIKNNAYLSDINSELISTYKIIKSNPGDLINALSIFKNTELEYYRIRNLKFDNEIELAAKFIYLNKTSFNGIYRVNKKGEYNVPYGFRNISNVLDSEKIYNVSELFRNTFFSVQDFKKIKDSIEPNDFAYFDPPYTVAHENNGFIQYNQSLFTWENQVELSNLLTLLNKQKVYYILSNAFHLNIVDLYQDNGLQTKINRLSTIGGIGAKRQRYNELLISNIDKKNVS